MDDLDLAGRREAPALGRHRTGAAAYKNDKVGRLDDGAGRHRAAVAADDADRERVGISNAAVAADRACYRRAEPFGECCELGFGAGDDDPAAADEERVLRGEQQRRGGFDRRGIGPEAARREAAQTLIAPDLALIDGFALDVVRQPYMRRTGPRARHLRKGGAHRFWNIGGAVD